MAFQPSNEYWAKKIKAIEDAIKEMERIIPTLTEERQITAHQEQLKAYRKSHRKAWNDFGVWRNKRQNLERGSRNY